MKLSELLEKYGDLEVVVCLNGDIWDPKIEPAKSFKDFPLDIPVFKQKHRFLTYYQDCDFDADEVLKKTGIKLDDGSPHFDKDYQKAVRIMAEKDWGNLVDVLSINVIYT
jgi:hypothetical protein